MNKKNIVLILILTIFLSVMVISVLGKQPEDKNRVDATSIVFYDENGEVITNVDEDSPNKDKVITIQGNETDKDNVIYNFSVELLPVETTDDSLDYTVLGSEALLEEVYPNGALSSNEDEPKKEVQRVHFYTMTFTPDQRVLTSIRFKFNKGGIAKFGYLRFTFDIRHEEDVG